MDTTPDRPRAPSLYCPFAPAVSPWADALQRASVAWAERTGLADSARAVARLERMRIGWLVARAVPGGAREALQVAADWTTLFCLLDDRVEGLSALRAASDLARLFEGGPAAAGSERDPYATALADLRARLSALASPAWVAHFESLVSELFTTFTWEAIHRERGAGPDLETYRGMREVSVGLHPEFALAELACGLELTPEERSHPSLRAMASAAARSVGWANDLFTCARERDAGEVHNVVLVLMARDGLSLGAAARRAAELHDGEVATFLSLQRDLAREGRRAEVDRYVQALATWMRGHLDWAAETGRYEPLQLLDASELQHDMRACLTAIDELATDDGLTPAEREMRLAQYAECAAGAWCPEAGFDPVAIRLRALAERLRGEAPEVAAAWESRVRAYSRHDAPRRPRDRLPRAPVGSTPLRLSC